MLWTKDDTVGLKYNMKSFFKGFSSKDTLIYGSVVIVVVFLTVVIANYLLFFILTYGVGDGMGGVTKF